jgi:hypothetical protein
MKRSRYVLLAIVAILLVAFVTKPSEQTCKTKSIQQVKLRMEKKYGKQPDPLMMKLIDLTAGNAITVKDKGLFRRIYFRSGKVNKPIGWAAFGMVRTKENY